MRLCSLVGRFLNHILYRMLFYYRFLPAIRISVISVKEKKKLLPVLHNFSGFGTGSDPKFIIMNPDCQLKMDPPNFGSGTYTVFLVGSY
jgi:hypothetical protein